MYVYLFENEFMLFHIRKWYLLFAPLLNCDITSHIKIKKQLIPQNKLFEQHDNATVLIYYLIFMSSHSDNIYRRIYITSHNNFFAHPNLDSFSALHDEYFKIDERIS